MKRTITNIAMVLGIIAIIMLMTSGLSYSQTTIKPTDKVVRDTTIKATKYPVYQGKGGGFYIIRTSAKTGNMYKQYLKKKK